jgi:hypothetical protein
MSSASTFIAAVWPFVRASKTSGLWRISRDRNLARLDGAFADLGARLLMASSPPGLSDTAWNILLDLWLRTLEVVDGASISHRHERHRGIR